jgi:hypothetical protein
MTGTAYHPHIDLAHHHPVVRRDASGRWTWACTCGGASCRTTFGPASWRQALVEALLHSTAIAP